MEPEKFEVVIAGVSGSYPECNSFHEFSQLLFSGKSGITVDDRRWPIGAMDTPPGLGKLLDYESFDSTFFGVSPLLAESTDPLTRMSLEKSVEALIDAGVNPLDLNGSLTGVVVSSSISESEFIQLFSENKLAILGANRAMQANRISFSLNLKGPSFQLDDLWTGGVRCLQLAKHLVEEGCVEGCLVATANLTISPCVSKQMQGLGCLSPDEHIRSFSSDANGYVRSEAAVAFYITRKENAKRSYGTIEEVILTTFGDRPGVFADKDCPRELESLLRTAYANLDKKQIGYVEAEGSAIKKLDAMECSVMKKVLCKDIRRASPLLIGSVKSVVGHAEASSATVSLSKALITLDSGFIPPNLDYTEPNPNADGLTTGELKVVTEKTPLPGKLVGVTTFSIGASFGHVVLKQFDKEKKRIYEKGEMYDDELPRLIIASGRTEAGLRKIFKEIKTFPADEEFAALFHEVYRKTQNQHNIRGYVLTPDISTEEDSDNVEHVEYYDGTKRPVWFIFSGMGSQWNGMGKDLLKLPLFRQSMEKLAAVLEPRGVNLFEILTSEDKTLFDNILNSFVGIAACQIGLVDILTALGIEPDGIVGHSVGELGCAYADGCFTAEQMILSAHARGRASIETDTIKGKMAAIGLGYHEMKKRLQENDSIEIACHNARDSCTLSGPAADIEAMVSQLVADGVFARAVNVANIAYHSRYIAPAAPKLLKYLKEVIPYPKERSSKWVSSSNLKENWDSDVAKTSSPEYHTNNLLSSVYFEEACESIPNNAICIEIAPHGLLQAILKRSLHKNCVNVPLTLKNVGDGVKFLLEKFGKLYLTGLELNLSPLYPAVSFPVSRGTKPLSQFVDWDHIHSYDLSDLEVISTLKSERTIKISMIDHPLYKSHLINNTPVFPISAMIFLALESLAYVKQQETLREPLVLENVHFRKAVRMPPKRSLKISNMIGKGSGYLEMVDNSTDNIFMTGHVNFINQTARYLNYKFGRGNGVDPMDQLIEEVYGDEVFSFLKHFGMSQSPLCQTIKKLSIYKSHLVHAIVEFKPDDWITFFDNLLKIPIYVYAEKYHEPYVPVNIESLLVNKQVLEDAIKLNKVHMLDVYYDFDTSYLYCSGVQFHQLRMKPVRDIPLPNTVLNVKNLMFLPYQNPALSTLSQYAIFCLQILLENIPPIEKGFNIILNLILMPASNNNNSNNHKDVHISNLINILNLQSNIDYNIIKFDNNNNCEGIDYDGKIKAKQLCYNFIFNENGKDFSFSLKILKNNKNTYLLNKIVQHEQLNLDKQFNIVSCAIIDNYKYLMIKNNGDQLSNNSVVFYMKNCDTDEWKYELKIKMAEAMKTNSLIFVVLDTEPLVTVSKYVHKNFIQDEHFRKNFQLFKFYFIFDKNAPLFSLTGKFYEDQIGKDLLINIFKNGTWGTEKYFVSENVDIQKIALDPFHQYSASDYLNKKLTGTNSGVDIKYLCISNKHLIVGERIDIDRKHHELGPLEYGGVLKTGHKVVGLAPFHNKLVKIEQDNVLRWTLPKNWTLEEGVTVPLPYLIAYYILDPKYYWPNNQYKSLLLATGLNAIGLAILNVFINKSKSQGKIFFCVKSDAHKRYVEDLYKKHVDAKHLKVIEYTRASFEVDVMYETKGHGVDLVINCLGVDYFQTAVNCCSQIHPVVFQLSKEDAINQSKVGMRPFMKCLEMTTMTPEDVFTMSHERKVHLQKMLQEGIDSGVVQPFPKKIITGPHTGEEALDKLNSALKGDDFERIVLSLERERPKTLTPSPTIKDKYSFETEKTYLIIGGKLGTWLELAEFLIIRGVRHVLVAIEKHAMTVFVSRKLNSLLVKYPSASIQLTAANKLDTPADTIALLNQSARLNELASVFLIHVDSETRLRNIHSCLQTKAYAHVLYVSMYCNDYTLCELRKQSGQPTLCIQSDQKISSLCELLNVMDSLLMNAHSKQDTRSSVLVNEVHARWQEEKDFFLLQNLKSHLPENFEELKDLHEHLPSEPCWEEVQTKSSRFAECRGNYPIFIIPGLRPHGKLLKKFIQNLLHPAFVAKYPANFDSIEETAKIMIRELGTYKLRTFNIVADSFGGILALHIAKKLTQDERYVRVSLLDAAPHTINSWVSFYDENAEMKLLSKYFTFSFKEKNELIKLCWADKLKYVMDESWPHFKAISTSLNCLLTRIRSTKMSILNTSKDTELMPYVKVMLLRPEGSAENDTCYLEKVCAGPIDVHVGSQPNYVDFLNDPQTVLQVNDNFLFEYPVSETPLYFIKEEELIYRCKLLDKRV